MSPGKVLATRWMRQFAHTWTHFASWVPWARFIQGTQRTFYAGSYTLVNTQVRRRSQRREEVACVRALRSARQPTCACVDDPAVLRSVRHT